MMLFMVLFHSAFAQERTQIGTRLLPPMGRGIQGVTVQEKGTKTFCHYRWLPAAMPSRSASPERSLYFPSSDFPRRKVGRRNGLPP